MTIIEEPDFAVRVFDDTDAESIARHANDPGIAANVRDQFPHPYGIADARIFIDMSRRELSSYAITVDGAAVGSVGLIPGHDIHRSSWELGYWLGREFWGRGIMSRTADLFSSWAFARFGINRLFAQVFETNPASARVLEKAGYVQEARQRAHVVKNGRVLDCLLYARLNPAIAE